MKKFTLAVLGATSAIAALFASGAAQALPPNTITLTAGVATVTDVDAAVGDTGTVNRPQPPR